MKTRKDLGGIGTLSSRLVFFAFCCFVFLFTPFFFLFPLATFGESYVPDEGVCPFLENGGIEGRRVVEISEQKIRADKPENLSLHFVEKTLSTPLPAGIYDISLASFDEDHTPDTSSQQNEQWFLLLKNASSTVVATTSPIRDIPDDVTMVYEKVEESLSLPQDIYTLEARHVRGFGTGHANSVVPLCAAFEIVEAPPASVCGNEVVEEGEMCDDGNNVEGDGCSTQCQFEALSCQAVQGSEGWWAEYFNYSQNHPDMEPTQDGGGAENTTGDPRGATAEWTADWYSAEYARFSRVDSTLDWGEDFFPFDSVAGEEWHQGGSVLVGDHEFYFGVKWQSIVEGEPGFYDFSVTSSDDAWVYVDGDLVIDNSGVHDATLATSSVFLTGRNVVEVYFANRSRPYSIFNFVIDGEHPLSYLPYAPQCAARITACKYKDATGDGESDDDVPLSGWGMTLRGVSEDSEFLDEEYEAVTEENGCYVFDNLLPGEYILTEEEREGWVSTGIDTQDEYISDESLEEEGSIVEVGYAGEETVSFYNYQPSYCGDGVVNQTWEQCDGGVNCTAQCQFAEQNQCRDVVLARVTFDDIQNQENGDMEPWVYVGSQVNKIPAGTWFALYENGAYITDPDITDYEDVAGLAVERQNGALRLVLHGSQGAEDIEHARGTLDFYNGRVITITSDNEWGAGRKNKLENGFDGIKEIDPWQDEVATTTESSVDFWFTVNTADDGFVASWDVVQTCQGICGVVFNDHNKDMVKGNDEETLSGWDVTLFQGTSTVPFLTQLTDESGYCFLDLDAGEYRVEAQLQEGWATTTDFSVKVSFDGEGKETIDFGAIRLPAISGIKFFDRNRNGQRDGDEEILSGWGISLYTDPPSASSTSIFATTTTDVDGRYVFANLHPGTYYVGEEERPGWERVYPAESFYTVELEWEDMDSFDFGNFATTSRVIGYKFNDINQDGVWQEAQEEGIGGWTIFLRDKNSVEFSTTTCGNSDECIISEEGPHATTTGFFWFDNVYPGVYLLEEEEKDGWQRTFPQGTSTDFYIVVAGSWGSDNVNPLPFIIDAHATAGGVAAIIAEGSATPIQQSLLDFSGDGILDEVDVSLIEGALEGSGSSWQDLKETWKNGFFASRIIVLDGESPVYALFGNTQIQDEHLMIFDEQTIESGTTTASVAWMTNIPATSRVVYGTTSVTVIGDPPLYGYATTTAEDDNLVISHSMVLEGLEEGTTYYWRAVSSASPEVVGEENSFTTASSNVSDDSGDDGDNGGGDESISSPPGGQGGGGGVIKDLLGTPFASAPIGQGGGESVVEITPPESPSSPPFVAESDELIDQGSETVVIAEKPREAPSRNFATETPEGRATSSPLNQLASVAIGGIAYQCSWWITALALIVIAIIASYVFVKYEKKVWAVVGFAAGVAIFFLVGAWSCQWLLLLLIVMTLGFLIWDMRTWEKGGPPDSSSEETLSQE